MIGWLLASIVAVGVLELFFCGLELNRIANVLIEIREILEKKR